MKKLFILISLLIFGKIAFSQYPVTQNIGNSNTLVQVPANGGFRANIINRNHTDTTAANLTPIGYYNGAQIYTTSDSTLWWRYNGKWIRMAGARGGASGEFWANTGNAGLSEGSNIFGTTDATAIAFTTTNAARVRLEAAGLSLSNDTSANKPMIWNTSTKAWGYSNWNNGGSGSTGWSLTGNSGTVAGTNFVGTTDNKPLWLKVNAGKSGLISNNGNTHIGYLASADTLGQATYPNTVFGYKALEVNVNYSAEPTDTNYAYNNTAIGYQALQYISPGAVDMGNDNTAIGHNAAQFAQSSTYNVAVGSEALQNGGSSSQNVAVGYQALKASNNGSNVAIGYQAMKANTGGTNIAIGGGVLAVNTGSQNVAIGGLNNNTSGSENTAVGNGALAGNTSSNYNTAIGINALAGINTNGWNTAVGREALKDNTTGNGNVAIGFNALWKNTTGFKNTAIGAGALENNTTGYENSFVGEDAGLNVITGVVNVGLGWNAKSGAKGLGNTVIGTFAGGTLGDTSSLNTLVGYQAGYNASQEDTVYNSIAIGANSFTTASNQAVFGNSSITQTKFWGALMPNELAGTSGQVLTSAGANVSPTWTTPSTVATAVPLSGITAATGTNSIDNADFQQTWTWNSLTAIGLHLESNSTAASDNEEQFMILASLTGANSNSGVNSIVIEGRNSHTGTNSTNNSIYGYSSGGTTNIGGQFLATGGTNNYAIIVPASSGSVGIGTSAPASLFTVGSDQFQVASTGVTTIGKASGTTGKINLVGTTSGTVGITTAAAAGTWDLTLPTTDGNSGEFLQTNGSGVTTWAAGGGTPGGSNTELQYNNSGAFGGITGATSNGTNIWIPTLYGSSAANGTITIAGNNAGASNTATNANVILKSGNTPTQALDVLNNQLVRIGIAPTTTSGYGLVVDQDSDASARRGIFVSANNHTTGLSIGYSGMTYPSTLSLIGNNGVTLGGAADATYFTMASTGAITLAGSSMVGVASYDLFNTVSTTLNFGGAATTLNVGGTPTTAITHNYSTNATATATTKTVNIGTGGASGSTTNINIGGVNGGAVTINNRLLQRQGADVASASTIELGNDGNSFEITGATQIDLISNVGWQNGSEITLYIEAGGGLSHGTATSGSDITILLAGAANFGPSNEAMIVLVLGEVGGVQAWREKSRKEY